MENIHKFKQWALGVSVAAMLGLGWACTDDDAPDNLAPGFSSYSVIDTKRSSAKLSATLTGPVDLVKEYGFQYSTSSEFPTDKTKTVKAGDGSPVGTFFVDFSGLERNEVYYYRVYASTGGTTVYSEYDVFTTPDSSAPAMSETRVVSIGESNAIVSFKLDDIGDEYLIECGVGYAKGTSTKAFTPVIATLQDSVYIAEITDLEPKTTYSFRPYAKNGPKEDGSEGVREGYGDIVYEETDELMAPEVITEYETSSGISSITVSGLVESAVGSNGVVFDCGFVWSSESQKPRLELNHESVSMKAPDELGEHFVSTITGLMANTTYYVCAYARNEVDGELKVGYGDVVPVTTGSLMKPNINIDSYETTPTRIVMQATITNYDKGALKEKGFIYDRSSEITYEEAESKGQIIKTLSGANVYTDTIPNLTMNTSYMVRAYAIYEAEGAEPAIGYSGSYNITTNDFQAPSIGVESNNITRNSVDLTGKMYGSGNGEITERGFVVITTDVTYEPTLKHKGVMKIVSDDTFVSTVTGLVKETQYSYRSYVISTLEAKVDTVYSGSWNTFWTLGINAPSFNNVKIENEKYNSFEVTCGISDIGDGKLLEKGFVFKKGDSDYKENVDSVVVTSENLDEFTTTIAREFEYNNWYYVSCYVKKDIDGVEVISRSSTSSIYIPAPSSPDYDEIRFDSITYNSFYASCTLNSVGDGKLLEKGFFWKKGSTDFSEGIDSLIVESDSNEEFSALITGLESSSSYYGGAYVKREINGKEFITRSSGWTYAWVPEPSSASFYSVSLEDATYKSFKATSGIQSIGDGTLLEKGFLYWKSGYSSEKDTVIVESDTLDTYSAIIDDNIDYSNWYYVSSYVKKDYDGVIKIETSSSNDIYIPSPSGVSFESVQIDSVDYQSFIMTGGISDLGDATLLEKGFFWKQGSTDFSYGIDSLVVESDSISSFSARIEGLNSSSYYYGGAYAKVDYNGKTVITRSSWKSVWTHDPSMPSFEDFTLEENTYRTLDVSVNINSENCDGEIIEKGFCWRKVGYYDGYWDYDSPSLEKNDSLVVIEGSDSMSIKIEDLEVGKEYYVRAYAKVQLPNGEQVAYSSTHGRTMSSPNMPSLNSWLSIPDEDRTRNSFKVQATISSKGNATITHRGFVMSEYEKNSQPSLKSYEQKWDDLDETFEKTVTGLKHNTTYAIRAFVIAECEEDVDTIYNYYTSNVTTRSVTLPSLRNLSFPDKSMTSFTVSSEVTSQGEGKFIEKGFCWSSSTSDFDLYTENIKSKAIADTLKMTLDSLQANTTYYVRAYAKVEVDSIEYVAYSNMNNVTTSSYSNPSLNQPKSDSDKLTRSSAYLTGVVSNAGNGVITERGFVLSKTNVTYEPTLDYNVAKVVANADFAAEVKGLEWNTSYAVRSYVIAEWKESGRKEVVYSYRNTFTTKNITEPKLNNVSRDSITYSSVFVTSSISSLGDGTMVEKGFVWKHNSENWSDPTLEECMGSQKVTTGTNESYSLKIDSLIPGRSYYVRSYVKFKVDGKEAVKYSSSASFNTSSVNVTVSPTPAVTTCDVKVVFKQEAENVKNVYVYLTTDSEETDLSKCTKHTLTQDETTQEFSKTIDGLEQNTTYYMKVYYEYFGNLINHTNTSFSTRRVPQSGDNVSPGKKDE